MGKSDSWTRFYQSYFQAPLSRIGSLNDFHNGC